MARSLRRQEKPRGGRAGLGNSLLASSCQFARSFCLVLVAPPPLRRRLRVSDPQRRQRLLVPVEEVVPLGSLAHWLSPW